MRREIQKIQNDSKNKHEKNCYRDEKRYEKDTKRCNKDRKELHE